MKNQPAELTHESTLPRLFIAVSTTRALLALGAIVLICGAAMLPAMNTMSDHGASILAFEFAGSVERSKEILAEWGDAGKAAAWWQLVLDCPFLVAYGLFLAGACTAVAHRAERVGRFDLGRVATRLAWLGPIAAAADMLQNISLALVLAGHVTQPWPVISAVGGAITTTLMTVGLAFCPGRLPQDSSSSVTGPSLTSATPMQAPKTPLAASSRSQKRS